VPIKIRDGILILIFTLTACLCCFLPLFDILGYESAALMGIVASVGVIWHSHFTILKEDFSFSLQMGVGESPSKKYCRMLLFYLFFLIIPIFILSLNALRVPNCDWGVGLLFWFSIPTVSIALSLMISFLCHLLSTRHGHWLAMAVILSEIALFGWRLAMEPPIMGFSWTFGWFAGSIYDEALSFPIPLIWHQLKSIVLVIAFVSVLEFRWRKQAFRRKTFPLLLSFISGMMWVVIHLNGAQLDYFHTQSSVISELGGRAESQNAIVYFQEGAFNQEKEKALLEDVEYRYHELESFFGVDIVEWRGRKIEIFIYPNSTRQQQLIGSRHTLVARPWTHQMHIRYNEFGTSLLAHEMAHLFSAEFGSSKTGLSSDKWGIPHIGLVEGIAVAADWSPAELSVHDNAAALFQMDKAPSIRSVFKIQGFWSQPSGKAYTMVGSFVRWLIETRGIEKAKDLYGHIDFNTVYGQTSESLISEWEAFLENRVLSERQLALANYRYDYGSMNRSIFEKTCARTMAELERLQEDAQESGRFFLSLRYLDALEKLDSDNDEHQIQRAKLYISLERWLDALIILDPILTHEIPISLKAEILELRGDVLWHLYRLPEAIESYKSCLGLGLSDAQLRSISVKIDALTSGNEDYQEIIQSYFLVEGNWISDFFTLQKMTCISPSNAVPDYLIGRVFYSLDDYPMAVENLKSPLTISSLEDERLLILGQSYYWTGQYSAAKSIFRELTQSPSVRVRLLSIEWEQRVLWRQSWSPSWEESNVGL
jgi:tetratricopeptide (TPR) repeat protein